MNTSKLTITKGAYDRPQCRHWVMEDAEGVQFSVSAERGYRNSNPGSGGGHTTWTVFVWLKTGSECQSIVSPMDVSSAPRAAAVKIVQAFLANR